MTKQLYDKTIVLYNKRKEGESFDSPSFLDLSNYWTIFNPIPNIVQSDCWLVGWKVVNVNELFRIPISTNPAKDIAVKFTL